MPRGRRKRMFSRDERQLLNRLFEIHKKPTQHGQKGLYYAKITEMFNTFTTGEGRTVMQLKAYHNAWERELGEQKQRAQDSKRSLVCSVKLSPRVKVPPGYVVPLPEADEGRVSRRQTQPDECRQSTSTGGDDTMNIEEAATPTLNSTARSPPPTAETPQRSENINSYDLVYILKRQAHQHHAMKMKLMNKKFNNTVEVQQMMVKNLNEELEMKRKEHERKMEILNEKYRKIQDQSRSDLGMDFV